MVASFAVRLRLLPYGVPTENVRELELVKMSPAPTHLEYYVTANSVKAVCGKVLAIY